MKNIYSYRNKKNDQVDNNVIDLMMKKYYYVCIRWKFCVKFHSKSVFEFFHDEFVLNFDTGV